MTVSNLITGGCGFVGCNLAFHLLSQGERVVLFDNLSRPDVQHNLTWLRERFGARAELATADVRDEAAVKNAVAAADHVFHFAAQVAVTTSLVQPLADFDVNARGTLHVLEAARARRRPPTLFYTSTNKVYGALRHLPLDQTPRGYEPRDERLAQTGLDEDTPLDFHSPYGCSKGSADQYVLDYARSFGLPAVVFRMSCIYGPRQFGTEDQGWLAHFVRRALSGQPITIYGDGYQTRDVLFIDDLVRAFLSARENVDVCRGHAFNIGGGSESTLSVRGALERIAQLTGRSPHIGHEEERVGDQRYYVSNTRKFASFTGWRAATPVEEGLSRLVTWMREGVIGKIAGADAAAPWTSERKGAQAAAGAEG